MLGQKNIILVIIFIRIKFPNQDSELIEYYDAMEQIIICRTSEMIDAQKKSNFNKLDDDKLKRL